MTGSTRNYNDGRKNNWRRTIWNEVLRRTRGREREELILYLAGPSDLDRKIAEQKGVPGRNLIAIDRYDPNIRSIRKHGGSALIGDVIDILWSWPNDRKVCAVLLDFCGGITFDTAGSYDPFQLPQLRDAIVMVNFLRGRDSWSNPIRSTLSTTGLLFPVWDVEGNQVAPATHRAAQFLIMNCAQFAWKVVGLPNAKLISLMLTAHHPTFYSYRSGPQRFDSAVFELPFRHIPRPLSNALDKEVRALQRERTTLSLTRQIAAILAVRTRRLSA